MSSLHYSTRLLPFKRKIPCGLPNLFLQKIREPAGDFVYHSDQIRRQAWRRRNEWERMQRTRYGRLFFLPCHSHSRESHGRTNKNRPRNGRATISTPNGEQRNGEDVYVGHENVLRDRRDGVKSDTVDNPARHRGRYALSTPSS